jgi:hypothetical protein
LKNNINTDLISYQFTLEGHVANLGEMRNGYKISVGKSENTRSLGDFTQMGR